MKKIKKLLKTYRFEDLKILYAIPLLITILAWTVSGFEPRYIAAYAASILALLGLYLKKPAAGKVLLVSCAFVLAAVIFAGTVSAKKSADFAGEFETAFATMKEHYVLTEEKGIDWDHLYETYKPQFEQAEQSGDPVLSYKTWLRFTNEFYDGHTGYTIENGAHYRKAMMESFGNDYGLSLMQLSTGEYVAANVEGYENSYSAEKEQEDDLDLYREKDGYLPETYEEDRLTLKEAGIKNGTVITKWNGKSIEEYFEKIDYYYQPFPVLENEEFYRPIYVAGIGEDLEYGETALPGEEKGDFATITYLDETGAEKNVKAPRLGAYMPRLYDTLNKTDAGENITNLTWKSIDEETMLLRICEMSYDQQSYGEPDLYEDMKDQLRSEVIALRESGIKNIILDLRSNTGGDPFFVQNVAGLFAPKGENLNLYSAVINEKTASYDRDDQGRYTPGEALTYTGEDLWHDGKIILLVNARCISAGDDMTYICGAYPNVRIMGQTRTNSSCQAVTGIRVGEGYLSFSAVPNIDEKGNPVIDTGTGRIGGTPFDERIPLTKEAVSDVFDRGEDYVLAYAKKSIGE